MYKNLLVFPTEDQIQNVFKEIGIEGENAGEKVKMLMTWYSQQPHLPPRYLDENFIQNFLCGCKGSMEKTKNKLEAYFTYRNLYQDYLMPFDPVEAHIKELAKSKAVVLPKLTPEGYRVSIYQDYDCFTGGRFFQFCMMINEIKILEDKPTLGDISMIDCEGLTINRIGQYIAIPKIISIYQDIMPARPKRLIFYNCNKYVEVLAEMMRKVVEKMNDRIVLVSANSNDLFNYVPKDIIPSTYGGTERSMDEIWGDWLQELKDRRDWFSAVEDLKADESLRPPQLRRTSIFGNLGSFKKFDID